MSFVYISKECFNKEKQCLHWVQEKVDKKPTLVFGRKIGIIHDTNDNDTNDNGTIDNSTSVTGVIDTGTSRKKRKIVDTVKTIQNTEIINENKETNIDPWDRVTLSYRKYVLSRAPKIAPQPTNGLRPCTSIEIITEKDISNRLHALLKDNCMSVYTRDRTSHEIVTTYFHITLEKWCMSEVEPCKDTQTKTALLLDTKILIKDLKQGLDLCFSYEFYPYMDCYVIKHNNQYLQIRVDCVK